MLGSVREVLISFIFAKAYVNFDSISVSSTHRAQLPCALLCSIDLDTEWASGLRDFESLSPLSVLSSLSVVGVTVTIAKLIAIGSKQ